MPKEKFYSVAAAEGNDPTLTVAWGNGELWINGEPFVTRIADMNMLDISGLNRLIRTLRRAREHLLDQD